MNMCPIVGEALDLAMRGDYDAALDRIASSGKNLCASDLVLQGRYILLSNGGSGRTPDDAQRAFERALELDSDHVAALTELGWLHYSVHDDATTGKRYFDRALDVALRQAFEALGGAARCVEELDGEEARNEFVRSVGSAFVREQMRDMP